MEPIDNIEGSDYINASFIKGVDSSYSYIAAQAPLATTVYDFVRMLWQYKVSVLICACNEFEGNKVKKKIFKFHNYKVESFPLKHKCHRYWPNDESEILKFNNIEARLISYEAGLSNEFVIREIMLKRTEIVDGREFVEERSFTQLHFIDWPDHGINKFLISYFKYFTFIFLGVPDNIEPILTMLELVHNRLNRSMQDKNQYLVVHCSAGCGRTGTLIAVDYCWNLLRTGQLDSNFSLFNIGKMLREQRTAMIQTFVCQ